VPTLAQLKAREVLDSRGRPTLEVEATSSTGATGRAGVPSGLNPSRHEARELRDPADRRYGGHGVRRAARNVAAEVAPALLGFDLDDQAGLDAALVALDGTADRARLGSNALYGASMAVACAAAASRGEELYVHLNRLWRRCLGPGGGGGDGPSLPLPAVGVICGGVAAGANLDFRGFLVVPLGATHYAQALETASAVYQAAGGLLRDRGEVTAYLSAGGGGYGPRLGGNARAVDLILDAAVACGLAPGRDVAVALDLGADDLFDADTDTYCLSATGDDELTSDELAAMLEHWARLYPIVSVQDPLAADDWEGWSCLTGRLGGRLQVAGGDLFCTQPSRLRRGAECRAANAMVVKPSQVGTLSETFEALGLARRSGYRVVISARSGETDDTSLADLAVATGAGQVAFGAPARGERVAKYNRLLRIEEHLGAHAPYAGRSALGL